MLQPTQHPKHRFGHVWPWLVLRSFAELRPADCGHNTVPRQSCFNGKPTVSEMTHAMADHGDSPSPRDYRPCGLCSQLVNTGTDNYINATCSSCGESSFHTDCVVEVLQKMAKEAKIRTSQARKAYASKRPAHQLELQSPPCIVGCWKPQDERPNCPGRVTAAIPVKPQKLQTPPLPALLPPPPRAAQPKPSGASMPRTSKPRTALTSIKPGPSGVLAARQGPGAAHMQLMQGRDRLGVKLPGVKPVGNREGSEGADAHQPLTFAEEQKRLEREQKKKEREAKRRASTTTQTGRKDNPPSTSPSELAPLVILTERAQGCMKDYKLSFCANSLMEMGFPPEHCYGASLVTGGVVDEAAQLLAIGGFDGGGEAIPVDVSREAESLLALAALVGLSSAELEVQLLACHGNWHVLEEALQQQARAEASFPSINPTASQQTDLDAWHVPPSPAVSQKLGGGWDTPALGAWCQPPGCVDDWGAGICGLGSGAAPAGEGVPPEFLPVWDTPSAPEPATGTAAARAEPTVSTSLPPEFQPVWDNTPCWTSSPEAPAPGHAPPAGSKTGLVAVTPVGATLGSPTSHVPAYSGSPTATAASTASTSPPAVAPLDRHAHSSGGSAIPLSSQGHTAAEPSQEDPNNAGFQGHLAEAMTRLGLGNAPPQEQQTLRLAPGSNLGLAVVQDDVVPLGAVGPLATVSGTAAPPTTDIDWGAALGGDGAGMGTQYVPRASAAGSAATDIVNDAQQGELFWTGMQQAAQSMLPTVPTTATSGAMHAVQQQDGDADSELQDMLALLCPE